jgi:hypothetical protein
MHDPTAISTEARSRMRVTFWRGLSVHAASIVSVVRGALGAPGRSRPDSMPSNTRRLRRRWRSLTPDIPPHALGGQAQNGWYSILGTMSRTFPAFLDGIYAHG